MRGLCFLPLLACSPLVADDTADQAAQSFRDAIPTQAPRTRGLRQPPPPDSRPRTGAVIRTRGPVPTLITPEQAETEEVIDPGEAPPSQPVEIDTEEIAEVTLEDATVEVEAELEISFANILFEIDSATVQLSSRSVLQGIAMVLKERPKERFLVEGHTCDLGDGQHNLRLSCLRAETVCAWLLHYGARSGQVQPLGFGESDLVSLPHPNESIEANEGRRAPNRRVTFRRIVQPGREG